MDYFLIPDYSTVDLSRPSQNDVLFYMYRAYQECYFSDESPGLFEFFENLKDQIHLSEQRTFSMRGFPLSRFELNDPYFVESLLKDFRFQYMGLNDKEICDCQNILFEELINFD